ncbi:Nucleoside-diphosphate-sugar epimerase family protein [Seminavis robusta]|uniref:Nucleoside-diphosphate-sugar epimerase family protein n=1 Tax=Seminavis robusta TaxID=568900 RepID=A0A9N8HRD6_9STRA|nr:Nucleoside-diphosphate-sugar epimerase family protein [Seminavis robusta]|eukprot:Sro1261_g257010.1 Nucleoside-diphosphate-sugar epimerase family protein (311) ;mRNA; f:10544-11476
MTDATYLIFLGTSRQGRATIDALKALGATNICATSRDPTSASSKRLEVQKVLKADYTDPPSVVAAIKESKATRIWFTTDWYTIKSPTREKEFLLGKAVIDAITKECSDQVEHVVYGSVGDADNCPETVEHFWSKADVEAYLKKELDTSKTTWSIIRPVAFFDNLDDPKNWNALSKGAVKFLGYDNIKYKFVATEDIGKGSAALLFHAKEHAGKTLDAVGGEHTGSELAQALTEASGVPCVYKTALPRFILRLFMNDLYHMTLWMEESGYTANLEEFKKVVPDAMDAKAWFTKKGQWHNGEKFTPKESADA